MKQYGDQWLIHTKFLWLKNPAELDARMRRELQRLRRSSLKPAWAMKVSFRRIRVDRSIPAARAFFERCEAWATRSRLKPMIHVAGIIRRHLENILNYLTHRITNAVTEGLNAKIQVDQVLVARLPESGAVQAGHVLPLRRVGSRPPAR